MSDNASRRRRRLLPLGLSLFLLFLAALVLHTLFDRLTPYTSEATLQAPVVGVAPNVSGTIISVSVRDNQPVHTGDQLFKIDPQRFEVALKQAEANLSNAVQSVGASTAALSAAAAKVSDANANLANERAQTERTLQLVLRNDASRAQGDVARAKLATAEGALQEAEASLEEVRTRLGPTNEDNPQIKLAIAQYQRARIDLNDTDVKAPVDGMVTNTVLAPGQYASAAHTIGTIVDTAAGWVVANLPENTLGNIRIGDPVLNHLQRRARTDPRWARRQHGVGRYANLRRRPGRAASLCDAASPVAARGAAHPGADRTAAAE